MCKSDKKIIFCTCTDAVKLSSPKEYIWVLRRFVKSENKSLKGKVKQPVSEIGKRVNIEKTLEALREGNPFDFDYEAQEKDCIKIHHDNQYLSVIYRNGQWEEGKYPPFTTVSTVLSKGKIKRKKIK